MQAFNKSYSITIVLIYLVYITLVVCTPSRYLGSSSLNPYNDDNIIIPVSSNYLFLSKIKPLGSDKASFML